MNEYQIRPLHCYELTHFRKKMNGYEIQLENILSIIEKFLLSGNRNIVQFSSSLKENLLSKYPLDTLKKLLSLSLETKKFYFIRHAEAEHNKFKTNEEKLMVNDPELTNFGRLQTKKLLQELNNNNFIFDVIFISPLKRTLHTFENIKSFFEYSSCKFIATDLIRGIKSKSLKNRGTSLEKMKKEVDKKIDLSFMTKNYWWTDKDDNSSEDVENIELFRLRIRLFLLWAAFKKENSICIISHSKVIKFINKNKISTGNIVKIQNSILEQHCLDFLN